MVIVLSHFVSGHTMREQNMPANSSETYIIWQNQTELMSIAEIVFFTRDSQSQHLSILKPSFNTLLCFIVSLECFSPHLSQLSASASASSSASVTHNSLSHTTSSHTCSETSYRITDVECIVRAKTLQLNLTGNSE